MHETVVLWEIAVQMHGGSTLQPYGCQCYHKNQQCHQICPPVCRQGCLQDEIYCRTGAHQLIPQLSYNSPTLTTPYTTHSPPIPYFPHCPIIFKAHRGLHTLVHIFLPVNLLSLVSLLHLTNSSPQSKQSYQSTYSPRPSHPLGHIFLLVHIVLLVYLFPQQVSELQAIYSKLST